MDAKDSLRLSQIGDSLNSIGANIVQDLENEADDSTNPPPVQIIKYGMIKSGIGSFRNDELTYKNISSKNIKVIRFRITGINADGNAADMNGPIDGIGGRDENDALRNGDTTTNDLKILSRDLDKITKAWVAEVVFSDGTKWKKY